MKERPILMSGEMVRAILDGRKTQTRRVIKDQPFCCSELTSIEHHENPACHNWLGKINGATLGIVDIKCPYGVTGDRLWVKETFFMFGDKPVYRADCKRDSKDNSDWWVSDGLMLPCLKWKPSLFMPRALSRIPLEVVSVRVERLQDISLEDARAEGVETTDQYAELWAKINGWESWEKNPFVWVVEFKKCANA